MFTEFLHPDAVLFGEPINPGLRCKHPYLLKDGEIIVHQSIMRPYIPDLTAIKPFKNSALRKRQTQQQRSEPQQDFDQKDLNRVKRSEQRVRMQSYGTESYEDEPSDESSEGEASDQEIANYQHNPFADQLYSVAVDAQYLPQQLNRIISAVSSKKGQSSKIPFAGKSQSQLEEQQQQWLSGEDDDTSWLTEQEVEEYLINEQLEEVSGSFATDAAA